MTARILFPVGGVGRHTTRHTHARVHDRHPAAATAAAAAATAEDRKDVEGSRPAQTLLAEPPQHVGPASNSMAVGSKRGGKEVHASIVAEKKVGAARAEDVGGDGDRVGDARPLHRASRAPAREQGQLACGSRRRRRAANKGEEWVRASQCVRGVLEAA